VLLAEKNRTEEAINHFREAIRFSPDYAEANYNLAETLTRSGRIGEAIREYQEVLRIDPKDQDSRRALEQLNRKGP
jgi:tetratricopeptide (TPR) repeat protein